MLILNCRETLTAHLPNPSSPRSWSGCDMLCCYSAQMETQANAPTTNTSEVFAAWQLLQPRYQGKFERQFDLV